MAVPNVQDPPPVQNNNDTNTDHDEDPDIAEMERMMALQEEHDREDEDTPQEETDLFDDGVGANQPDDADAPADEEDQPMRLRMRMRMRPKSIIKVHYTSISFLMAVVYVIYVLRTRKQVYLSLLYLTSSKLSYIVIGNAILATFVSLFHQIVQKFLNGLRLMETETIVDHIRWNVTETCIALTMFRQEINVKVMGIFLVLIFGKCLHWAVELRANHMRMTEEVFYFLGDDDNFMFSGNGNGNGNNDAGSDKADEPIWWLWRAIGIFMPKSVKSVAYEMHQGLPRVRSNHLKLFALMGILYLFDVLSLTYCASHLLEDGPSVFIMFLFESAILMCSIMSSSALYSFHTRL